MKTELYKVALYLRLSREDNKIESDSISSQREMIQSYVRKHKDMEVFDIYIDDGWSGMNFNRPAFKRMMEDIRKGYVNCVIVKDLSRLGRDYIEAGRLIQKIFPSFSVRFIALTDNFDSLTADFNEKALILPIKNFVNDSYCRDISEKVRSHQKVKRENGEFIGSFTIYGYKKSLKNKNMLIPDDYAAYIVRKIFYWKLEGFSNSAIACKLNEMGILSPLEYKKSKGEKFQTGFQTGISAKWSAVAVKRILQNENYIGTLVQGKEEKVNYKLKKVIRKPEEQWTKVENTHTAIISKEDFVTAGRLLEVDTRASSGTGKSHPYSGILFCGDCMQPMIRRVIRYNDKEQVCFICATKNNGGCCTRHCIKENELNKLVLTVLKYQLDLFMDRKNVLTNIKNIKVDFGKVAAFKREIISLNNERDKYLSLKYGLLEDLEKNIITQDDYEIFKKIFEQHCSEILNTVKKQQETVRNFFISGKETEKTLEQIKESLEITDTDRWVLITFINKILVFEDKRVYIEFKHKELFSEYMYKADYKSII